MEREIGWVEVEREGLLLGERIRSELMHILRRRKVSTAVDGSGREWWTTNPSTCPYHSSTSRPTSDHSKASLWDIGMDDLRLLSRPLHPYSVPLTRNASRDLAVAFTIHLSNSPSSARRNLVGYLRKGAFMLDDRQASRIEDGEENRRKLRVDMEMERDGEEMEDER
ncbi:hypothetical protein BT69DRAFT_1098646 [Atractiella rhizophila]|nr:hypothetical protein BT69DRAFT_1098646 [Atractiella rhizophila]